MQRYFALEKNNNEFIFNDVDAHHLLKVMRVKLKEEIEVVYDKKVYLCFISSISPLIATLIHEIDDESELNNPLTLFYCLVKGDKLDLVIQKACELGVSKIILLTSKRTIINIKNDDVAKKLSRYRQIIKSASEQSHRNIIPEIDGIYDINKIDKNMLSRHNFIAYELEKGAVDKTFDYYMAIKSGESVSMMVGPEGGFEPSEVKKMNDLGFKSISLGKRILRSETAAIASIAQLAFILENHHGA